MIHRRRVGARGLHPEGAPQPAARAGRPCLLFHAKNPETDCTTPPAGLQATSKVCRLFCWGRASALLAVPQAELDAARLIATCSVRLDDSFEDVGDIYWAVNKHATGLITVQCGALTQAPARLVCLVEPTLQTARETNPLASKSSETRKEGNE